MQSSYDADVFSWYFKWPRVLVTGPILLVAGINLFFYFVFMLLTEFDLFLGNLFLWFFFGEAIFALLAFIPVGLAWAPIALLPLLWESHRIWGIAKVGIFGAGFVIMLFLTGFISTLTLRLLGVVATLRTTLWWAELWGAA